MSENTEKRSYTEYLVDHMEHLCSMPLTDAIQENARMCLLDHLAAVFSAQGGKVTSIGAASVGIFGDGHCTLIGTKRTSSMAGATFYNALITTSEDLDDAHRYDMLLIDEPESSFDNLFLRDRVNQIIRELSENMPVILVTHNNTVGASIRPDYLVYTKRVIGDDVTYERYYGLPSSKELTSFSGKSIKNFQVILDCLEAGETTYNERKHDYDLLKD